MSKVLYTKGATGLDESAGMLLTTSEILSFDNALADFEPSKRPSVRKCGPHPRNPSNRRLISMFDNQQTAQIMEIELKHYFGLCAAILGTVFGSLLF